MYQNNTEHWELRGHDELIEFKTIWRGDYTQWRIVLPNSQLTWRTEYRSDLNYWYFENDQYGLAEFYTVYKDDPRDWEFVDQSTNLLLGARVAMMFISVFYTIPKN